MQSYDSGWINRMVYVRRWSSDRHPQNIWRVARLISITDGWATIQFPGTSVQQEIPAWNCRKYTGQSPAESAPLSTLV